MAKRHAPYYSRVNYIKTLSLLLLVNCSPSFDEELRIERVKSGKTTPIEVETPLWTADFEKEIFDGDTYLPSHIYDHILRKLHKLTSKRIREKTLEGFHPDNPPHSRGKFWRISGVIARIWPEEIPDSHSPLSRVFAGILYTEEGLPVLFHLSEKPRVLELGEDVVELDGLFLKEMRFRGANGETITAPFFLAKSLRKLL